MGRYRVQRCGFQEMQPCYAFCDGEKIERLAEPYHDTQAAVREFMCMLAAQGIYVNQEEIAVDPGVPTSNNW